MNNGIRLERDATQLRGVNKAIMSALTGAVQAAVAISTGSASTGVSATTSFLKALGEIEHSDNIGRTAYLMVAAALASALQDSLPKLAIAREPTRESLGDLAKSMLDRLDGVTVSFDFLEKPQQFPFLKRFSEDVALNLEGAIPVAKTSHIEEVIRGSFVGALYRTLALHPKFNVVTVALTNPVSAPLRREVERNLYQQSLVNAFERQLLPGQEDEADPVALRDVFIPLRAYHERRGPSKDKQPATQNAAERLPNTLHLFEQRLRDWIRERDAKRPIMVVSGGPGMGKSSSLRALAAGLVRDGRGFPVFLPLQLLESKGTLEERVHEALRRRAVDHPIDHDLLHHVHECLGSGPLVLMFDGLDELVLTGEAGDQALRDFVGQVERFLAGKNQSNAPARVLAIISGRIGAADRAAAELGLGDDRVLHFLPFWLSGGGLDYFSEPDKEKLGDDQRRRWWQQWRQRRPGTPDLPAELFGDDLSELSSEPLLLYFLASAEVWAKAGTEGESVDRNTVYDRVLRKFHEREVGKQHSNLARQFRDFDGGYEPILQALALAAWYDGSTRKGRMDDVYAILESQNEDLVDDFRKTIGEKPSFSVSLSFHLRPVDGRNTFEFLHKTFAEYLVARRFVSEVESMAGRLSEKRRGKAGSTEFRNELRRWVALWGVRAIDQDLLRFLRSEAELRGHTVANGKDIVAELFRHCLAEGMPAHEIKGEERAGHKVNSFSDMTDWARNAEESLLAALHLCVITTEPKPGLPRGAVSLAPSSPVVLGDMMHRLGRQPGRGFVWSDCLAGLDFSGASLTRANLTGAYLSGAGLKGSILFEADFWSANLTDADLSEAELFDADISNANLTGANLLGADVRRANLRGTDFSRANLSGANLTGANLLGADLREASHLPEVRGLRRALNLDAALLPAGWSASWNAADDGWDIVTPGDYYVDPAERGTAR